MEIREGGLKDELCVMFGVAGDRFKTKPSGYELEPSLLLLYNRKRTSNGVYIE